MTKNMWNRSLTVYGVAIGTVALTTACGGNPAEPPPRTETARQQAVALESETPRVMMTGLEVAASQTLDDWVSTADAVVVARAGDEHRHEPPRSESERGSESSLIGRSVTLTVAEVLWASPELPQRVPDELSLQAYGWARSADGTESEAAPAGRSRLEVGHHYVLALIWKPAECGDDEPVPARWSAIGSGGILPADQGVIGVGEFEGTVGSASNSPKVVGPPLAHTYAGARAADLAKDLSSTIPSAEGTFVTGDTEGCEVPR